MGTFFKLLLTILVILIVFWVVKFRARPSVIKNMVAAAKKVAAEEKARAAKAEGPAPSPPVALVPCPKCGTYLAQGTACHCDTPGRTS